MVAVNNLSMAQWQNTIPLSIVNKNLDPKQDLDRAITLTRQFIAEMDSVPAIRLGYFYGFLGALYMQKEQHQKALDAFNQAITLEPKLDIAYISRGDTYLLMEHYREAVKDYSRALELSPDNTLIDNHHMALGRYAIELYKSGEADKAIAQFRKAIHLNARWRDDLIDVTFEYKWTREMIELASEVRVAVFNDSLKSGEYPRISVNREMIGGLPAIRNSRMPAITVMGMLEGGASDAGILDLYPNLEQEDIDEVRRYRADHRELFTFSDDPPA